MSKEKTEKMGPKYSIIMKFWTGADEVECVDFVTSYNKITQKTYINFFDTLGRMWQVPEDDCLIIKNYPDKDDMEFFERIQRETKEVMESKGKKKEKIDDVSFT